MAALNQTFEAVYEHGVLRPLEELSVADGEHVKVSIAMLGATDAEIAGYFPAEDWAAAKHDAIGLADVRSALSGISGSLAESVTALRDER